ncbi:hypothetical protein [Aliikangiella sp. IMCC44359]|uniref:hypothetical protein n=1 Tax=Aliikangiella sp. IMCC44359 TaxID=3459125 RepID=UPI00403AA2D8
MPIKFSSDNENIYRTICQIYPQKPSHSSTENVHVLINHNSKKSKKLELPARFHVSDKLLVGCSGNNYFCADRVSQRGQAFICEKMLDNEYLLRHQVLNTICFFILTEKYFLPVHASSFVFNGFLVLCLGESGVGKSTLAMAALKHNLQVVSEDVCFIGTKASLGIQADCREIHLLADSYSFFDGDNNKIALTHNGKSKYIVKNSSFYNSDRVIDYSFLEPIIIFIRRSDSHKTISIEPISNNEHFSSILSPKEKGFNLRSEGRMLVVKRLKGKPCFKAYINSDFSEFFNNLKKIQDDLVCTVQ